MYFKRLLTIVMCTITAFCMFVVLGCSNQTTSSSSEVSSSANVQQAENTSVKIASLKGGTSIGLAPMMVDAPKGYEFSMSATANEVVPLLAKGEVDIALIPANVAASVYNQTQGKIQVVNINTLGVLYGISYTNDVLGVSSLSGKTVYMTGKGTVPEYTFKYLLQEAGVDLNTVSIEFCSEPTEVVAKLAANTSAVGIVPEPFATAAQIKDANIKRVLDLTKQWSDLGIGTLVTGVTVVTKSFADAHPEALENFLTRQAQSVYDVNSTPSAFASKVVELGIVGSEKIVEKAVPLCNIVDIEGEQMKTDLQGYLEILNSMDSKSIGDNLPQTDFYYVK